MGLRLDRLSLLIRSLESIYGNPLELGGEAGIGIAGRERMPPLDTLILTILSQATTDEASLNAFRKLRKRFPSWLTLLRAGEEEIEEQIREAGLAPTKAVRIKRILERLYLERGEVSLDFLEKMSPQQAFDYLRSFGGVGPKTAACVLLFSLDKPAFPVDTHVSRVLRRLGLVPLRDTPERIRTKVERHLGWEDAVSLHLNLLRFGREVCRSVNPRCRSCPLATLCESRTPVS